MSYEDFLVGQATDIEEEQEDVYPDDDAGYESWKDDQAQIEDERLADLSAMLAEFKK
jgi:hypothetical protein